MSHSNADEYRYRCPKGHVTIRRYHPKMAACNMPRYAKGSKNNDGYYCNTCKQRYEGKPIDLLEEVE